MIRFERRTSLHAAGLAALLVLSACGGEDKKDTVDPATATRVSRVTGTALQALLLPPAAGHYRMLPQAPQGASGEFGLTCPEVTTDRTDIGFTVAVNYGTTGCVSELDGLTHSGLVTLNVALAVETPDMGFVFDQYTTRGYTVTGSALGRIQATTATLTLDPLHLSGNDLYMSMSGTVDAAFDDHSTPTTLSDDIWQLTLALTVTVGDLPPAGAHDLLIPLSGSAPTEYTVTTVPGSPLIYPLECRWPTSGKLLIAGTASRAPQYQVDFGAGLCDDEATVTVAGQTFTVHLDQ